MKLMLGYLLMVGILLLVGSILIVVNVVENCSGNMDIKVEFMKSMFMVMLVDLLNFDVLSIDGDGDNGVVVGGDLLLIFVFKLLGYGIYELDVLND